MERILILPGADAIEDDNIRWQCSQIPALMNEILYAQSVVQHEGINLDLESFMLKPKVASPSWFQHLTVASIAIQVGVFKEYISIHGTPENIMGCSLGDVSRNICIGSTSYEESLLGMFDFSKAFTQLDYGQSIHITLNKPFSENDLSSLQKYDLYPTILQTPNHFLIGGRHENALKWAENELTNHNYKMRVLYPYPLHTHWMSACYDLIERRINKTEIKPWTNGLRVYSAVEKRFLTGKDELQVELKKNILSTVNWKDSILQLATMISNCHFVNLGPAPTLVYFHKKTFGTSIPITDFFTQLKRQNGIDHEAVI